MITRKALRTSRQAVTGTAGTVLPAATGRSFLGLKVPADAAAAVNVCIGLDTFDVAQSWPIAVGEEMSFVNVCPIGQITAQSAGGATELVVLV